MSNKKLKELLKEQENIKEINKLKPLKRAIKNLLKKDKNFLKNIIGETH